MENKPDLKKLGEAEKDQLILEQSRIILMLQVKIKELEDRLSKNSSNSSKPPSSDGFAKPDPKSRRNKDNKKKKVGGQHGHPGKTLKQVSDPNFIKLYKPSCCSNCQHSLDQISSCGYEARQVFELPPLKLEVTEHRAYKKSCPQCGIVTKGNFPAEVNQATQYGSKMKGLMVYMNQYQLMPFDRTREFFLDVFNQSLSAGTINLATKQSYERLSVAEEHIKKSLIQGSLLHSDETGFRINQANYWLHVSSTAHLTFYAAHKQRGRIAMDEINLLPQFKGRLMHDHLKSYFQYGSAHSLCNAHHLRELTFVQERYEQKWAKELEELLIKIKRAVESQYVETGESLSEKQLKRYWNCYINILYEGRKECPPQLAKGKKLQGRSKQTPARNLLKRLRQFDQCVLAFMYNPTLPFDNNQAERDIRMMKVQQKISGCFRTFDGAKRFCRIRGYISTAKKQGISILTALQKAIENEPILFGV